MAYTPYSDIIIKMQKEIDSKDREITLLKSIIDDETPDAFKQQEIAIVKLERQLELKDKTLRETKSFASSKEHTIAEKEKSISELQQQNVDLRKRITELKTILMRERDAWEVERARFQNTTSKRKTKHKSEFEKEFSEARPKALERDSFKCKECGSNKELHVHHIVHRKDGGTNDLNNLVTLCKWCHAERHKVEPVYKIMTKGVR